MQESFNCYTVQCFDHSESCIRIVYLEPNLDGYYFSDIFRSGCKPQRVWVCSLTVALSEAFSDNRFFQFEMVPAVWPCDEENENIEKKETKDLL